MQDLIARLEAATGPNMDLDRDIHIATHPTHGLIADSRDDDYGLRYAFETSRGEISCPAYTASIDAALSLVPEDHLWSVFLDGKRRPTAQTHVPFDYEKPDPQWTINEGKGTTPAIALCIAALRARLA